jgi:hypothetical protein
VLLVTVPGISQISHHDAERWGDYWRFTPQSLQRLLTEVFAESSVALRAYGNVRSAAALLDGRAAHELRALELNHADPDYPVIVAARAVRRGQDPFLPPAWDAVADRLDEVTLSWQINREENLLRDIGVAMNPPAPPR